MFSLSLYFCQPLIDACAVVVLTENDSLSELGEMSTFVHVLLWVVTRHNWYDLKMGSRPT